MSFSTTACRRKGAAGKSVRWLPLCAGVSILVFQTSDAASRPGGILARYEIRIAGLSVGEAKLTASFDPERYRIKIAGNVGLLFINRAISGEAAGLRLGNALYPLSYHLAVEGGAEDVDTKIEFQDAQVKAVKNKPLPSKEELAARVPVRDADLKDTVDPLSAVIAISFAAPENPCSNSLQIFTGSARMTITLSSKKAASERIVCRIHYRPISGQGRDDRMSANLARSRDIEIELSRSAANVWLIERFTMPTPIGTAVVQRLDRDL